MEVRQAIGGTAASYLERHQDQLLVDLQPLIDHPDPAAGLSGFFVLMLEQARAKKVLVHSLEQAGIDFRMSGVQVTSDLRRTLDELPNRVQHAGAVRPET
ncbi:hypothetical protein MF271_00905 (plasmid) [Deinococcus sp. KNUC1210]|uniref:SbtR family transcriptional regulator n=1 Tax=Deinococcus sp. KNUC1210 TaxID=2917691 RepID=UPI001EF0ED11|nr:hypothetical protein [Deinococcus sp. KNUC1210]ULH14070.1 hypothetical protein MF271_00905 [Deinococcus sp. KNUC1210]